MPTKAPLSDEEEPTAMEPPEAEEGVPAWLKELGATLSAEPEGEPALDQDATEVPDWLHDLRASLPQESQDRLSETGEAEDEGVPDWLADLRPSTPKPGPEPGDLAPEAVEAGEIPDWLAELRPSAPDLAPKPEMGISEGIGEEVPDWLAELRPAAPELDAEAEAEEEIEEKAPDWLAELQPAAPDLEVEAEAEEVEEIEEGEVPDWLAELQPAAPELEAEPEAEEEIEAGEVPDWLAELQPAAPDLEVEAEPEEVEEIEAGEVPDWLAELQPAAPDLEVEAEAEEVEELEAGEVPGWLAELQPAAPELEVEAEPEEVEEIEAGEVPGWLAELQPAAPELEAEPEEVEGIEAGEVPGWLAELQPAAPELEVEAEPEEVEGIEAGEVPGWLAELRPPALEPESVAPDKAKEAEIPDWLVQLGPPAPPLAEGQPLTPAEPGWPDKDRAETSDVSAPAEDAWAEAEPPDWLVPSEEEWEASDEALVRADIPAWLLALKPKELREEGEAPPEVEVAETVEETGLLAGLGGTLPVEMLIAQPRAVSAAEAYAPVSDTPQARLFSEIVGRPPETASQAIEQPRRGLLASLPRWLLYGVLIVAVTVPLLLSESPVAREFGSPLPVQSLSDTIEELDAGAPVLVAFDYDPTTSGEMDVVAQAIVGHLMDRQARVVVVSLLPAGPATAQTLLDVLAANRPGYADGYGQRYVNLGYLPGQAAAVRLLGQSMQTALPRDFRNLPLGDLAVMEGLTSTGSFELLVELAPTQDSLRWWIEQGSTPSQVPLGAGVSASVEPMARAYYETEAQQLVGLVAGVPGAAAYQALRSDPPAPAEAMVARLDSQLAGHLVFVVVLLIGNVVYLVRRGSGRER